MFGLGADIIMQLDDVVHSSITGPRLEEATFRSTFSVVLLNYVARVHSRSYKALVWWLSVLSLPLSQSDMPPVL